MITAVLDTNVLASGVVGISDSVSLPGAILRFWAFDGFHLVVSEHILTELTRTLSKPYFRSRSSAEERDRIIALLQRDATVVPITARV
ncbi:MAG TPA: PIN domain-containing protein, partial [Thermomicrobiales bacterium]|nr:PIN domain-containing protein [Thermomicrobiales bacterium]